jgi:hypothetical protein
MGNIFEAKKLKKMCRATFWAIFFRDLSGHLAACTYGICRKQSPGHGIHLVEHADNRIVRFVDPLHDGQGGQLAVEGRDRQNALKNKLKYLQSEIDINLLENITVLQQHLKKSQF